jgi:hypothetical protein
MNSFYTKAILQSLPIVVITFDETGRVSTVENPQLLQLEQHLNTMRLTSFEHWLGRNNLQLSHHISQTLMTGKHTSVTNYDFSIQGNPTTQIKYSVRKLSCDSQSSNQKSFPDLKGRKMSQARIPASSRASSLFEEMLQPPNTTIGGCLLVMEVTHPNQRVIDQLSCQLSQEMVSEIENSHQKMEGEIIDVAILVIDIRRCMFPLM